MSTEQNRFYINPDTQDRIPAVYKVRLVMPALHDGFVDVEATSENEAAEFALGKHYAEIQWDYDSGDKGSIEVLDVDCEVPPENEILVEQGYYRGNASIDVLFGDQQ
jgi:hypothetical protein